MLPFQLPDRDELGDYASFTDETDVTAADYMIIGGVSCRSRFAETLDKNITALRQQACYPDSFQWKNINYRKLGDYKRLIDLFYQYNEEHLVDFHAVAFECGRINHKEHNEGDSELGFYKFVFQSMFSSIARYRPAKMRCIHGNRISRYDFRELQDILNSKAHKEHVGSNMYMPFREVKYASVRNTGPLQLADVLIGAVGSEWNARKGTSENSAKSELAAYVRAHSPVVCLNQKSPLSMRQFDIWPFKLKSGAAKA